MRIKTYLPMLVLIAVGLFSTACLLPGMIPLTGNATSVPMPVMEKDSNKVIETLNADNYVRLDALAQEKYTEQDYAKPGTLTFSVKIKENNPVYFSYYWCAIDQKTLQQNFQHINVSLYFNGEGLGRDVVHNLSFTSPNNQVCADFGVLMSNWPAGQYKLKTVATFDQKINDGISDYEAGDYIQEYTVDVQSRP